MSTSTVNAYGQPVYDSSVLNAGIVSVGGLTPDALMLYLADRLNSIDEQANAAFEKQQRINEERKSISTIQNIASRFDPEHLPEGGAALTTDDKRAIETALSDLDANGEHAMVAELRQLLGLPEPPSSTSPAPSSTPAATSATAANGAAPTTGVSGNGMVYQASGESISWTGESSDSPTTSPVNATGEQGLIGPSAISTAESGWVDPNSPATATANVPVPTTPPAALSLNKEQLTSLKTRLDNQAKALESSASLEMIHLQSVMSARQTAVQLATNLVSALGKSEEAIAANIGH